jgi:hypothetical protein
MTTFPEFTEWLFPGDKLPRVANPPDTPPEMLPLLEEVAACTNIPLNWLENVAGLVIEGLAGLQCLWYLHGLRGEIAAEIPTNKYGIPNYLGNAFDRHTDDLASELFHFLSKRTIDGGALKKKFGGEASDVLIDWPGGRVLDMVAMPGEREFKIVRTLKLGKWLRKQGASKELMHAFETREMPVWEWEISCNPYDILTMSHERPWISCMRPGGEYEYGPLTDMAAGSALMFFYRPGAEKPCGRRILRPGVSSVGENEPLILDGGQTYGCGPEQLAPRTITDMLFATSRVVVPVYRESLCDEGQSNGALSRYIYSDVDFTECSQSDEQYNNAYHFLDMVPWPPINLDFTTEQAVAESFKGLVEIETPDDPAQYEWDAEEMAYQFFNYATTDRELEDVYAAYQDQPRLRKWLQELLDADYADEDVPDYIADDIYRAGRWQIQDYLSDELNAAPTLMLALPPSAHWGKDVLNSVTQMEREYGAQRVLPDDVKSQIMGHLPLSKRWRERDDWTAWFDGDWNEVAEIIFIPTVFDPFIPESVQSMVIAHTEIPDYDWKTVFLTDQLLENW